MGLKSVFGKIGRKISGAFGVIVNVIEEIFTRGFGFPDFLFGWLLESLYSKKLRLTVVILTKPDGTLTTSVAGVERSIEHAEKTLKSGANITFKKSDIRIIDVTAPPYVLRVEAGISAFGDLFQAAGEYFRGNSEAGDLTAFVIDDVIGSVGSSASWADFILLDNDGITRGSTLVHEIGHACVLYHWNNSNNFMKTPSSISANRVNWWQSNILRSSRHVGYS
jgi:hypothetical protein